MFMNKVCSGECLGIKKDILILLPFAVYRDLVVSMTFFQSSKWNYHTNISCKVLCYVCVQKTCDFRICKISKFLDVIMNFSLHRTLTITYIW